MDEQRRPSRFQNPTRRLSDDHADVIDSELSHGDDVVERAGTEAVFTMDLRHAYDETQALEVIAVEPGWMHGERFYDLREPRFEDRDMFLQDFGFRRPGTAETFWRSIDEDEPMPSEAFDERGGFGLFWNEALQAMMKWNPEDRLQEPKRELKLKPSVNLSLKADPE